MLCPYAIGLAGGRGRLRTRALHAHSSDGRTAVSAPESGDSDKQGVLRTNSGTNSVGKSPRGGYGLARWPSLGGIECRSIVCCEHSLIRAKLGEGPMTGADYQKVEVAVTIIQRGDQILAGYNANWAAYTLPMTKRRRHADTVGNRGGGAESWEEAALRNVAEWFGDGTGGVPEHLLEITDYRQSDRDLIVKDYHLNVFRVIPAEGQALLPGVVAEWLFPRDFQEIHRRPISPTAKFLVDEVQRAEYW